VPLVLQLPAYPALVELLQPRTRKQVAQKLAMTLLDTSAKLGDVAAVEALFDFIRPLVDGEDEEMDDEVSVCVGGGLPGEWAWPSLRLLGRGALP
jgi:hypothetical protein